MLSGIEALLALIASKDRLRRLGQTVWFLQAAQHKPLSCCSLFSPLTGPRRIKLEPIVVNTLRQAPQVGA